MDNLPLNVIGKYLKINFNHDFSNFCREVNYDDLMINMKPIGGPGQIVEIDESKFGKRKHHRGKRVEGQWIFGGFEWESRECSIMVPVGKRDIATLVPIIKKNGFLTGQ